MLRQRDEARMLAEALLDAEVRIGELFAKMPKASHDRGNQYTGGKVTPEKLSQTAKTDSIEGLGFSKKQAHQFEQLASHPDLVEQVKAEARENDDLPAPLSYKQTSLPEVATKAHGYGFGVNLSPSVSRGYDVRTSLQRSSEVPEAGYYPQRCGKYIRQHCRQSVFRVYRLAKRQSVS